MSKKLDAANFKQPIASQILLNAPLWSKESFMMDFLGDWGEAVKPMENSTNECFVFEFGGSLISISYTGGMVPAEKQQYLVHNSQEWSDAKEIVESHKASIIVLAAPISANSRENAVNAAKVVCSMCLHQTASAVEVGGALISPMHYRNNARVIMEGRFPAACFVHFGAWRPSEEARPNAFTAGLSELGFNEVEVIDSGFNADFLREFLEKLSIFIIENDLVLEDGDVLSPHGEGISVELSKGVVYEEAQTLKLTFPRR